VIRRPRGASGPAPGETAPGISVATLAWAVIAALFIGLRLAASFTMPVFGPELDHLGGAWLARVGVEDERYIPTLFQAITSLLLRLDAAETYPRLVAVAASASIPLALYLLRGRLGDAGAAGALLLLALNPVGIALGASANAMALDEAVSVWFFAAFVRGWTAPLPAAAMGFGAALCGPGPSLVLVARLVTARGAWWVPRRDSLLAGAAAAAAGLLFASARFGLGFQELTVPPLDLLAAGSERRWATLSAGEAVLLYLAPLVAAAVLAGLAAALGRGPRLPGLLFAWLGFAAGWWAFSAWHENPAPAAALATPAAIVAGPMAVAGVGAALRRHSTLAAAALAGAAVLCLLAGAIVADWARLERSGPAAEQALVALFLVGAAASCAVVVYARAAAWFVPVAGVLGLALLLAGASRIAVGASEPLLSPLSPPLARQLREAALAHREATGLEIVVHPRLAADVAWSFRDSGTLVISSRVPPAAGFVLWPVDEPQPEGFAMLAGDWALTRSIRTPTADTLDFLHWWLDRNTLVPRPDRIAVYTRSEP
jgi:hypothetical protein